MAERNTSMQILCGTCSLRRKSLFRPFSDEELAYVTTLKSNHVTVPARVDIIGQGEVGGPVYTLYEGWAVRYRRLPDGSRQIFDILLPGDMIGLESALIGAVQHSVQAITPASLCVLDGGQLLRAFAELPALALSLLRSRLEEEQRADVRMTLLGRRSALQRLGYLMLETCDRLRQRGMAEEGTTCPFPLTRQHLADAAGLSNMHLTRTLNELRERRLAVLEGAVLVVFDWQRLSELVDYVPVAVANRAIF